MRGLPHILQLALLLQPFQVDVRGGARHAAERLEVTSNQHVVVGKVFFQLHVYLHFRKLQGGAGVGSFELSAMERRHSARVLEYTKGNKTEAARLLKIGLTTLYRKIEEYKISDL